VAGSAPCRGIGGRVGVLRSLSNTGSWPHSGCAVSGQVYGGSFVPARAAPPAHCVSVAVVVSAGGAAGLTDPTMPDDGGPGRVSVVRLDRDAVLLRGRATQRRGPAPPLALPDRRASRPRHRPSGVRRSRVWRRCRRRGPSLTGRVSDCGTSTISPLPRRLGDPHREGRNSGGAAAAGAALPKDTASPGSNQRTDLVSMPKATSATKLISWRPAAIPPSVGSCMAVAPSSAATRAGSTTLSPGSSSALTAASSNPAGKSPRSVSASTASTAAPSTGARPTCTRASPGPAPPVDTK
jgi:hypothetical protein